MDLQFGLNRRCWWVILNCKVLGVELPRCILERFMNHSRHFIYLLDATVLFITLAAESPGSGHHLYEALSSGRLSKQSRSRTFLPAFSSKLCGCFIRTLVRSFDTLFLNSCGGFISPYMTRYQTSFGYQEPLSHVSCSMLWRPNGSRLMEMSHPL